MYIFIKKKRNKNKKSNNANKINNNNNNNNKSNLRGEVVRKKVLRERESERGDSLSKAIPVTIGLD